MSQNSSCDINSRITILTKDGFYEIMCGEPDTYQQMIVIIILFENLRKRKGQGGGPENCPSVCLTSRAYWKKNQKLLGLYNIKTRSSFIS